MMVLMEASDMRVSRFAGFRMARLTVVLVSLLALLAPSIPQASAQSLSLTIYIAPVDAVTGAPLVGACFVIVNASNEGCDENGDGMVRFAEMLAGTYTVTQTGSVPGYADSQDFTINISPNALYDQVFTVALTPYANTSTSAFYDISIVPIDASTGVALPGACFVVGDVSLEGCDENSDGQVTFADIPAGSYLVHQTKAPRGFDIEADQWIVVGANGPYPFFQGSPSNQTGGTTQGLVDVALVTRDPDNGELVTGTCYVIVNASIEGCDENGDGQVDFADVTPGEYTVTQTKTPAGYPTVGDFTILITRDPDQAFPIKQARQQNDADHRTISVVLVDSVTGDRITTPGGCVQIERASKVGCDRNGDGQIDFLDIPIGTFPLVATSLPSGYESAWQPYALTVDGSSPYQIQTVYLPIDRP